jgi:hypothetical protein
VFFSPNKQTNKHKKCLWSLDTSTIPNFHHAHGWGSCQWSLRAMSLCNYCLPLHWVLGNFWSRSSMHDRQLAPKCPCSQLDFQLHFVLPRVQLPVSELFTVSNKLLWGQSDYHKSSISRIPNHLNIFRFCLSFLSAVRCNRCSLSHVSYPITFSYNIHLQQLHL